MVYGCEFAHLSVGAFLQSWLWSIGQRFVVNEPVIILIGVLVPILFATECCANLCTETCNSALGIGVAVCITVLKRLRRF